MVIVSDWQLIQISKSLSWLLGWNFTLLVVILKFSLDVCVLHAVWFSTNSTSSYVHDYFYCLWWNCSRKWFACNIGVRIEMLHIQNHHSIFKRVSLDCWLEFYPLGHDPRWMYVSDILFHFVLVWQYNVFMTISITWGEMLLQKVLHVTEGWW